MRTAGTKLRVGSDGALAGQPTAAGAPKRGSGKVARRRWPGHSRDYRLRMFNTVRNGSLPRNRTPGPSLSAARRQTPAFSKALIIRASVDR